MQVETIIDDGDGTGMNTIERVVVERQPKVIGKTTPPAFLTIFDDGDNECVFHYRQVDDIIGALQEAKKQFDMANKPLRRTA